MVKLVREEEESDALRAYLDGAELVSSELVLTEILTTAVDLDPIEAFVTYDERQAAAARLAGLRTMAPGA